MVKQELRLAKFAFGSHVVEQREAMPIHMVGVHPVFQEERCGRFVLEVIVRRPLADGRHPGTEPDEHRENVVVPFARGTGENAVSPVRIVILEPTEIGTEHSLRLVQLSRFDKLGPVKRDFRCISSLR